MALHVVVVLELGKPASLDAGRPIGVAVSDADRVTVEACDGAAIGRSMIWCVAHLHGPQSDGPLAPCGYEIGCKSGASGSQRFGEV